MDPLSIIASVVTIGAPVQNILKAIRMIKQAEPQLVALQDDILGLQAVLFKIGALECQAENPNFSGSALPLQSHFARAKDQVLRLEKLIYYDLVKYNEVGEVKVEHLAWFRNRSKVIDLQTGLRDIRSNLNLAVGLVNWYVRIGSSLHEPQILQVTGLKLTADVSDISNRIELQVQNVLSNQARHSVILAEVNNRLSCDLLQSYAVKTRTPSPATCQFPENPVPRFRNNLTLSCETAQAFPAECSLSRGKSASLSLKATASRFRVSCSSWCSCICHTRHSLKFPRFWKRIAGVLMIEYSGLPMTTPACNQKRCYRNSAPAVDATYYFPSWLLSRALILTASATDFRGPQLSLAMPRMVSWSSPLWRMSQLGDMSRVQSLLGIRQASPFDINAYGQSALHYAAHYGQLDLCKFLISIGADMNIKDENGRAPIDSAWDLVFSGRSTEFEKEYTQTIFNDEEYMETRQFTTIHKITLRLIEKPLLPELDASTADIDKGDANGRTSLSWAAARGDIDSIQALVDAGANPHITDFESCTPLVHAVKAGNLDAVGIILKSGANEHVKDAFGGSVLHVAASIRDQPAMLELLLRANVEIDLMDEDGDTALQYASRYGFTKNALCLLDAGANPNIANLGGETALGTAVLCDSIGIVSALAKRGADPTRLNARKESILFFAAKEPRLATINALAEANFHGLDPDTRSTDGLTCKELFLRHADSADIELYRAFDKMIAGFLSNSIGQPDDEPQEESDHFVDAQESQNETSVHYRG